MKIGEGRTIKGLLAQMKLGLTSEERILAEECLVIAFEDLYNQCRHPGCCCICGHQGKCPEDGPSCDEQPNYKKLVDIAANKLACTARALAMAKEALAHIHLKTEESWITKYVLDIGEEIERIELDKK